MRVFDLPRGMGKTTIMLNWLNEAPPDQDRVLLVHQSALSFVRQRAISDFGWNRLMAERRIFGTADAQTRLRGLGTTEIGIDELDRVLQELLQVKVNIATLTTE